MSGTWIAGQKHIKISFNNCDVPLTLQLGLSSALGRQVWQSKPQAVIHRGGLTLHMLLKKSRVQSSRISIKDDSQPSLDAAKVLCVCHAQMMRRFGQQRSGKVLAIGNSSFIHAFGSGWMQNKWEDLNVDDIDVRLKWTGLFHRRKRTPGKFMMCLKVRCSSDLLQPFGILSAILFEETPAHFLCTNVGCVQKTLLAPQTVACNHLASAHCGYPLLLHFRLGNACNLTDFHVSM